jgi:hypothetical protein
MEMIRSLIGSNLEVSCWIAGLFVSLVIGQLLTRISLGWIRGKIKENAKRKDSIKDKDFDDFYGKEYFSPSITGSIERLFFTILVGFDVSGTATAMMVWIGAKMAANWLIVIKDEQEQWKRQVAFTGLLGTMISLFIALIGGLICRYKIWVDYKEFLISYIFPSVLLAFIISLVIRFLPSILKKCFKCGEKIKDEELKTKKDEYEVSWIRRLELKEELKRIKEELGKIDDEIREKLRKGR